MVASAGGLQQLYFELLESNGKPDRRVAIHFLQELPDGQMRIASTHGDAAFDRLLQFLAFLLVERANCPFTPLDFKSLDP